MKKVFLFFSCLLSCLLLNAQDKEAVYHPASLLKFNYCPTRLVDNENSDPVEMHTVGIHCDVFPRLNPNVPLCFYLGVGSQFTFRTKNEYESGVHYKEFTKFISFDIPVGISGDFWIGENFGIRPLAAIVPSFYLNATTKIEEDGKTIYEMDFLDKEKMDNNPYKWFVLDWKVGVSILLGSHFALGYEYRGPITNLYSVDNYKLNLKYHSLSLAIAF